METCGVWNSLTPAEKESKVGCNKHPFDKTHSTADCKFEGFPCKKCSECGHHFLLCPKTIVKASGNSSSRTLTSAVSAKVGPPTLLQALYIQEADGEELRVVLGLCSMDDYVLRSMVRWVNP